MMYGAAMLVPLLNLYCLISVRGRIREKYGIEGSLVNDLLAICCCPLCAMIQSARQVKMQPGQGVQRV
jgi:Cys-rich protein (TIGR01571 family)